MNNINNILKNYKINNTKVSLSNKFKYNKSINDSLKYVINVFEKFIKILNGNDRLEIKVVYIEKNIALFLVVIKEIYNIDKENDPLLTVNLDVNPEGKTIEIKFSSTNIEEKDCEILLNYFINTLEKSFIKKDVSVHDLLNEKEIGRILKEFNKEVNYTEKTSLIDMFNEVVDKSSNQTALVCNDMQYTYYELKEKIVELSDIIRRNCGIKQEEKIGILLGRSCDYIVSIFSILFLGSAYVPMDIMYPKERLRYIINDSDIRILIVNKSTLKMVNEYFKYKIELGDFIILFKEIVKEEKIERITSTNLAYVIYTSGSTGNPKGVMVEHNGVVNLVHRLKGIVYDRYKGKQKVGLVAPFVFDVSIQQIFPALLLGHTLFITSEEERKNAKKLVEFINNNDIDIIDGTPTHMDMINIVLERIDKIIKPIHFIIGGEELHYSTVLKLVEFLDKNIEITNIYGPTECCVETIIYDVDCSRIKEINHIPIGKPITNTRAYILDKDLEIVPIGSIGELFLSGICVSRGYVNNKELTDEVFIEDPFNKGQLMYKTGDLASWCSDGNIIYNGRKDNQVKLRGYRIELGEIEKKIKLLEYIKDACVKIEEYKNNKILVAYIIISDENKLQQINNLLGDVLPEYMIPQKYIIINEMPINTNGKADRKMLTLLLDRTNKKSNENNKNKLTENQKKLLNIFIKILSIEDISINDSFFELGGDSLMAFSLLCEIFDLFNIEIEFSDIYKYNSIKLLDNFITNYSYKSNSEIIKKDRECNVPVTFMQKMFLGMSNVFLLGIIWNFKNKFDKYLLEKAIQHVIDNQYIFNIDYFKKGSRYYQSKGSENKGKIIISNDNKLVLKNMVENNNTINSAKGVNYEFTINDYSLVLITDHIIIDMYSFHVIIKDIIYKYNDLKDIKLEENYLDYAIWQKKYLSSFEYNKHRDFYLEKYSKLEKVTTLLKVPRDIEVSNNDEIKNIKFSLENKNLCDFQLICNEFKCTKSVLIMSLFQIILYNITNDSDIVLGIFNDGRGRSNYYKIAGNCAFPIPLIESVNNKCSIFEHIERLINNISETYKVKSLILDDISKDIIEKTNKSFPQLFNITLNYLNLQFKYDEIVCENIESVEIYENECLNYEMNIIVIERNNSVDITVQYSNRVNRGIIEKIERFFYRYIEIICNSNNPKSLLISELNNIK